MNVKLNVTSVTGAINPVKICQEDGHRRYLGLYAKSGTCVVSVGEGDHFNSSYVLAEGILLEPSEAYGSPCYYSGDTTTLLVLTDRDRPSILTYSNVLLTYDSETIFYTGKEFSRHLPDPVFN